MHIIQASNKEQLLSHIQMMDEGVREVYINARPSMDIVMKIFDRLPGVQTILCPPSLLKQTSTKVFKVASEKGVTIAHKEVRVGRPDKYHQKIINEIHGKRGSGVPVKEIATQMNIPLRTVYYHLKNSKPNNP